MPNCPTWFRAPQKNAFFPTRLRFLLFNPAHMFPKTHNSCAGQPAATAPAKILFWKHSLEKHADWTAAPACVVLIPTRKLEFKQKKTARKTHRYCSKSDHPFCAFPCVRVHRAVAACCVRVKLMLAMLPCPVVLVRSGPMFSFMYGSESALGCRHSLLVSQSVCL